MKKKISSIWVGWIIIILLFIANENAGVLFLQQRIGKNNKVFKLLKFKENYNEKIPC